MEGPALWPGLGGGTILRGRDSWVEELVGKPRRYGEVVTWHGVASRLHWWKYECVEFIHVCGCSGSSGTHDVGRILSPHRTP